MGKYDGPNFDTKNDVVSVWISQVNYSEIPDDYWTPDPSDEDEAPWDQFSTDFGFGYYDNDFVESFCQDDHSKATIYEQLKYLSYSQSFIEEVEQSAREREISETSYVFLMYNFKYDTNITKIEKSNYFIYLGTFDYDKDSEPCEVWTN